MGETIRILMVAAFLAVTYGPSLRAQSSTAGRLTPGYRHEVRFTPASKVVPASTDERSSITDFTPVGRPELPSQSKFRVATGTEQRYKPQGPGGFDFPNSLGGVGNALRDAASAATDSLANSGRNAVNQTIPTTRSNTPSTAPNPRRDNSWMRNTPDPRGNGATLPSTSRSQTPSGFGSAGFGGGGVATVAGTQDPNSREARLMDEQRQQNAASAQRSAATQPTTNRNASIADSANFGRAPAGMSLPTRDRQPTTAAGTPVGRAPTGRAPVGGSFGSEFGRTAAAANTPQSRQPFGPQTADEAGFDFARYNQTQQSRESQSRATTGSSPFGGNSTLASGSAQSNLGFPRQSEQLRATLQGWTPKQLEELAGMFGIQPDDKRLADPLFLNKLYENYPAQLGKMFGLNATDRRLADQSFIDKLYAEYLEQRDAAKRNVQPQQATFANQNRSSTPTNGTGLRNDYAQSPFGQPRYTQNTQLQSPLNQRQSLPQGQLLAPQLTNNPANQYAYPDNRLASRDVNGVLGQLSPSAMSQPGAPATNAISPGNSRRDVDPRLSDEEIAKLPKRAWGYDKFGNFINKDREIVDKWGDPVPESEYWDLTIGRKQRSQNQQGGRGIDGDRWGSVLPTSGLAGGDPNRPMSPPQQGQLDPRVAMAGGPTGFQPNMSVNAGRPNLQDPPSSSDNLNGQNRPPADQAGSGVTVKERSHPLVNLSLFCSFAANVFLFYWIHRLWHKLRGFIASSRVNAANAIAAE